MVHVNNFENASRLTDMLNEQKMSYSHPFAELSMGEMQNLSSCAQNTSKDYLPGLQLIPDRGDTTPSTRQTLEHRSTTFSPSAAQRIPFVSEITPEFMKSVKEQFSSMLQMFAGDPKEAPIKRKAAHEGSTEKPPLGDLTAKEQSGEPTLSTTIRPNGNNGYREINTLKDTNKIVSTVDVYLDPKTQSITRLTRMADGKMFSIETENKDKSRQVITFDENEKKMSTQLLLPDGSYEWRDAEDKIIFSNIQTAGKETPKIRK